jgi:hypothetical protein
MATARTALWSRELRPLTGNQVAQLASDSNLLAQSNATYVINPLLKFV